MSTHYITWAWTFNAFPGVAPSREWGLIGPTDFLILPDDSTAELTAIFHVAPDKLRLQLGHGTRPDLFPARVVMGDAVYGDPAARFTVGLGEARDYQLLRGQRPAKLTDATTAVTFEWDPEPTADPKPEPEPEKAQPQIVQPTILTFDPNQHFLLRDIAHRELLTPEEYQGFEHKCREAGLDIFQVAVPDWPPVPYSPLALIANLETGWGGGAWWDNEFWTGMQPAVGKNFKTYTYPVSDDPSMRFVSGTTAPTRHDTIARYTGREMAGDRLSGKRLSYMWQIPVFDAAQHIDVRSWIESRGLNIVKFLRDYASEVAAEIGFNPVFETTNPNARAEHDAGGGVYRSRIRAISVDHQSVLKRFADAEAGQPVHRLPKIVPRPTPDDSGIRIEELAQGVASANAVSEGAVAYDRRAIARALEAEFGQMPRVFGGALSDSALVAITRDALRQFLGENQVDKARYVADKGNRNFDCENFAEGLRVDLARKYGLNSIGIVWGDGHAWNLCVVVGSGGPEIVLIEPQDDSEVTELQGIYSIARRCEILL